MDPELEHKLNLMFMGVVAIDVHAWTPNLGLDHEHFRGDSAQVEITNNERDVTNHEAQDWKNVEKMIQLREQITSALINEMY
ncbi:hypothetical protein IEQ34_012414 [Dendrobium chrysotoxum]|uniref:Uncharacterized protein n=1 Tax=Dendrobium chrysotoxum TaxID=161865 RepID=A0AAV7GCW6_DENCH|nr:hypothetical protein IEQ34_012414 [Dendrobium chrysotoxum]